MEDKNEEISIPASAAERLDQRTFPESEIFPASRPMLTPREREIAIAAVSARAGGSPVEVAKQVLAGVAVLDGCHLPIVVWPADTTPRQQADWLLNAATDQAERADRFDARMRRFNPDAPQALEERPACAQASSELEPTLQPSASSASTHPEEDTDSRPQTSPQAQQDSSGAC